MPNIIYLWDFEDGTTQGWTLGPHTALHSTTRMQGTRSLRLSGSFGTATLLIASISNVSLSGITRPILVFPAYIYMRTLAGGTYGISIIITVTDGSTSVTFTHVIRRERSFFDPITFFDDFRIIACDLRAFADRTVSIHIYAYIRGGTSNVEVEIDMISIMDNGDYQFNVNIRVFNGEDTGFVPITIGLPINLSTQVHRIGISLANPPHPLTETTDIFEYRVVTDTATLTITSTSETAPHLNYTAPSTPASTVTSIQYRAFPQTATSRYLRFSRTVVITFMNGRFASYVLVIVLVVSINVNYVDKLHTSRSFKVQPSQAVTFSDTFTMALAFSTLRYRLEITIYRGSYTSLISKTITLTVTDEQNNVIVTTSVDINDNYVLSQPVEIPTTYSEQVLKVTVSGVLASTSDVCLRIAVQTIAS